MVSPTKLMFLGALILASAALSLRSMHDKEVTATPGEATEALVQAYRTYLDQTNHECDTNLSGDYYRYIYSELDSADYHTFLTKCLRFEVSEKFTQEAWSAIKRPSGYASISKRLAFFKQFIDKAACMYLVDSQFYRDDFNSDGNISQKEFKQALPRIKHWFQKGFFKDNLAESYEQFQSNGDFGLSNWRRMFEEGVPSAKTFVERY